LRCAQAAQAKGDSAREAANVRRETVTALTKIAEGLLLGGHYGATRDTLRRVTSTLEALSSYGSTSDVPSAGRLTDDVEPPGFDAVAVFVPRGKKHLAIVSPTGVRAQRSALARANPPRRAPRAQEERRRALAGAEVAVRDAERALRAVRKQAERAAARLDSAATRVKATEVQRILIEKRLARASKDADAARVDASDASTKAAATTAAVDAAERALELARRRLEQLANNEDRE
jgi:hypothetical protein